MIKEQQKKVEIGIVKSQDILENQAKIVFLGIGSNLGLRKTNIEKAKFLLAEHNLDVLSVSSYYETPCLLYTSPSPRDRTRSRMPSSA